MTNDESFPGWQAQLCEAESTYGWCCTRRANHSGDHISHITNEEGVCVGIQQRWTGRSPTLLDMAPAEQRLVFENHLLYVALDKTYRFLCGLRLKDQPISVQREYKSVTEELRSQLATARYNESARRDQGDKK